MSLELLAGWKTDSHELTALMVVVDRMCV